MQIEHHQCMLNLILTSAESTKWRNLYAYIYKRFRFTMHEYIANKLLSDKIAVRCISMLHSLDEKQFVLPARLLRTRSTTKLRSWHTLDLQFCCSALWYEEEKYNFDMSFFMLAIDSTSAILSERLAIRNPMNTWEQWWKGWIRRSEGI